MRRIDEVIRLRQDMRNALKRAQRKGDLDEIGKIKYNIEIYSRQLSKLRREVTTCDEVKERAEAVRAKLQRVYVANIMGAVAEMELENIHEQTLAGRQQKARSGLWNGAQAPFGYSLVDKMLTVCPEEAEIVKEIFRLYTEESQSIQYITKKLNDENVRRQQHGKTDVKALQKKQSAIQTEISKYNGNLFQTERRLAELDADDKHYEKKVDSLNRILDELYGKIDDAQDRLTEVNDQIAMLRLFLCALRQSRVFNAHPCSLHPVLRIWRIVLGVSVALYARYRAAGENAKSAGLCGIHRYRGLWACNSAGPLFRLLRRGGGGRAHLNALLEPWLRLLDGAVSGVFPAHLLCRLFQKGKMAARQLYHPAHRHPFGL